MPGGTVASARLWLRAAVHAGPATSRMVDPSSVVNDSTSLRLATCTRSRVISRPSIALENPPGAIHPSRRGVLHSEPPVDATAVAPHQPKVFVGIVLRE